MNIRWSEYLETYLRGKGHIENNQLDTKLLWNSEYEDFWFIFSWHIIDILLCWEFDKDPEKTWWKICWYRALREELGDYLEINGFVEKKSEDILYVSWSATANEIDAVRCMNWWKIIDVLSIVQPPEQLEDIDWCETIVLMPDITLKT